MLGKNPIVSVALVALLLAGCELSESTRAVISEKSEATKANLEKVVQQGDAVRYDPLVITDKVWAGDSALRIRRGIPLPPKFEADHGIAIVSSEPVSFQEIINLITEQTGIPVRVTDLSGSKSGGAASKTTTLPTLPSASAASAAAGSGASASAKSVSLDDTMSIAYEGSLSGLLERLSGNFGVSWKFDGASILISRFETRVFSIESLPGTQRFDASIQGGATSGGGGGSSGSSSGSSGGSSSSGAASSNSATMNASTSVDIKYWDELSQVINSMLNGTGTVVLSPSLGTVTVRTTPEIMQNIASYLAKENERMTRQIAINVEVYNVALKRDEDFNMTFQGLLKKLSLKYNVTDTQYSTDSIGNLSALSNLTTAVLNPNTSDASFGNTFTALSTTDNSTRVAQFPLITMNNRPVSVRVGNDKTYVSAVKAEQGVTSSTSTSSASTVTVTVETSQLSLGFAVQVAPRILDDGRILLQYALTSVDLVSLTAYNTSCADLGIADCSPSSNSNTIQLPETTNRIFSQQSVLRSGSVLFIGGISQDTAAQRAGGVGDPYSNLVGGGRSSEKAQTMMLIAITPQVIDLPRPERG